MTRFEKVIKGLEYCAGYNPCPNCGYYDSDNLQCQKALMRDALELLKERLTACGRWVKMTGMMPPECRGHYECSECRWHMRGPRDSLRKEEELSYCPNCGAKMDLEDKDNVGRPISSL